MKNKTKILILIGFVGFMLLFSGCYTRLNMQYFNYEYIQEEPYYPPYPPPPPPYYPPGNTEDSGNSGSKGSDTHTTKYRDNTGDRNPSNGNTTTRNEAEQKNEDKNSTTRNSGERNSSRR